MKLLVPNSTITQLNGISLAGLATGILKNTTATGVPSIAVAGDFPTLNQNTTGSSASCTGNAATVTTNANLTGHVTSTGNDVVLGSFTSAQLATALTDETGSGANVFATSPTLVAPALGTPASGVVTNLTGTASININGTVGATTLNTGAFSTITAVSTTSTTLELGHATDTTISRASAGRIAVEGVQVAMVSDVGGYVIKNIYPKTITATSTQALTSLTVANITDFSIIIAADATRPAGTLFAIEAKWCGEITAAEDCMFGLSLNSTAIGAAIQAGSRNFGFTTASISYPTNDIRTPETAAIAYIHTPNSTAQLTYTMTARHLSSVTLYNQRTNTDTDTIDAERLTSTFNIIEYRPS